VALTVCTGEAARYGKELLRSRSYSLEARPSQAEQVSKLKTTRAELSGELELKNDVSETVDIIERRGTLVAGT
jgi:hypothetical protein